MDPLYALLVLIVLIIGIWFFTGGEPYEERRQSRRE